MLLNFSSATAFTPPPVMAVYEPVGRRGDAASDPRPRRVSLQQYSALSEELPLQLASEKAASALVGEKPTSQAEKSHIAALELSKRVQFLRIEAEVDSVPFSDASFFDLQAFMHETRPRVRPYLFLNDNGNLRALWKSDAREQIGLQFLGEGNIQFVIFKRRLGISLMARFGVDAKEKILAHIRASGAEDLLFG
jgi:hypothetical protein